MNPNLVPTEEEITAAAEQMFPCDLEAQMSFTLGVWRSITDTNDRELEKSAIKAGNINEA